MRPFGAALMAIGLFVGCSSPKAPTSDAGTRVTVPTAPPVQVASVRLTDLPITVTAPGQTEATAQTRIRAPFAGRLVSLRVRTGDRVKRGEKVGELVAKNSEAELEGARALLEAAKTPEARKAAQRAVANAESRLVHTPLRAPKSGVVGSPTQAAGDLLQAGDVVLTLTSPKDVVFIAQVLQTNVPSIRPGQPAVLRLAASTTPIEGRVHALLPQGTSESLTLPVRIDPRAPLPTATGLFGTATITTGTEHHVQVVPEAAVLRNDVTGISKVAVVNAQNVAHWVTVTPGLHDNGEVEIRSPGLGAGMRVITSGQVGLPEGTRVEISASGPLGLSDAMRVERVP